VRDCRLSVVTRTIEELSSTTDESIESREVQSTSVEEASRVLSYLHHPASKEHEFTEEENLSESIKIIDDNVLRSPGRLCCRFH
jgi:hypothetical protein